ncbi:unnamed protein product [Dibothriocephalus latus]|uniref:Protein kinase domain-containing protein n=1 Tax=Dibothriocephalus latus TaxID=60516 RepID=A0A3P6Q7Y7_DIBLA|nr:unnamed protein product [Dibothriocephalus latus]
MEVAVMLDLNHTNLVRLCGWDFQKESLYIITELVPGETLVAYLQRAKKKDLRSLGLEDIVLGIAEGLQYLQARMLVHRDLAARNIFLDKHKDNNPKVGFSFPFSHCVCMYYILLLLIVHVFALLNSGVILTSSHQAQNSITYIDHIVLTGMSWFVR